MKKIVFSLIILTLFTSCKERVTKKFLISDIPMVAEAPLFDGPNTLQAQFLFDPKTIDPALSYDDIEHVTISRAEITASDSSGFDQIRNMVLQFTSANAAMQKAGVLNPVPKGVRNISINPSAETELTEHFKQSEITIVLDADLEGDREEALTMSGSFEFEIKYNSK